MSYLEREASSLYFNLSRFYLHEGRLSWDHFIDRMLALKQMCETSDPFYERANRILRVEDWNEEDLWPNDSDYDENSTQSVSACDEANSDGSNHSSIFSNNDDIYYLSRRKGLKDWEFHQYDVDFHPSIPHGHYLGRNHPKLDAYLGWIYQGSRQINRIGRNKIIDLWNDEEFRVFALKAIEWYSKEFPNYNWRVNSPLIIPKRRN